VLKLDELSDTAQGKKLWSNLGFLFPRPRSALGSSEYAIFEKHSSVVISGFHHFDWYGYAFGNLGDPITEEYRDEEDELERDIEEDTDDWFYAEEEDFVATGGGCHSSWITAEQIMDPRVYFLRAVQHRIDVVVKSHEYLVRKLERGFRVWVSNDLEHSLT
jgi:hypothetical protein